MQFYDVIAKKRDGGKLSGEEIDFFVHGAATGSLPDYQISALLMAIYLRGMDDEETARLTLAMAHSGDVIDLSSIPGVKVDKHSTGGVGDKTSLIIAPVVAACGVSVAKMSGRGLGHTGGTIDKLESIPGFQTECSRAAFLKQVADIGIALVSQSGDLAPADKKLYALRDVTATVGSLPLIASSIMSKKLAAGSDAILLDVKVGRGALLPSREDAFRLARAMVSIGTANGKKTAALLTGMDAPLGGAVGNSIEVAEAIAVLKGGGPGDLRDVSVELSAGMLQLAGQGSRETCLKKAQNALSSGRALSKLRQFIAAQGGDTRVIEDPSLLPQAAFRMPVLAGQSGFVTEMDALPIGAACVLLGAGRLKKEDSIDHAAGVLLHKKTGDPVQKGEALATLLCKTPSLAEDAAEALHRAFRITNQKPPPVPLLIARIDSDGTTVYESSSKPEVSHEK